MDEVDDSLKSKRVVFVTVGTTCFDALVRSVDTLEIREALFKKGYTHLVIQMGHGTYIPTKSNGEDGSSISVDYFTFSPSIAEFLKSASLVISHAGSGSIFETLRLRKPLIVVVNEDLMDNHQSELVEELAERKHLFCARPQTLDVIISSMNLDSLVTYKPGDAMPVARFINRFLGEMADWEHVQPFTSPFADEFIAENDESFVVKEVLMDTTTSQNRDRQVQEPEPGCDGVNMWRKLALGVWQDGILQIVQTVRKYATGSTRFLSLGCAAGGIVAFVLFLSWHRRVVIQWQRRINVERNKEKLMLLIREKDLKINQLLLQLAEMNEILLARRRVAVIRTK